MGRLTYYSMKGSENDGWYLKPGVSWEDARRKLAAYEDADEQGRMVVSHEKLKYDIKDDAREIYNFICNKVTHALKNKNNDEHIFKVLHDALSIGMYKAQCDYVLYNDDDKSTEAALNKKP